jgi:hypothetical protein
MYFYRTTREVPTLDAFHSDFLQDKIHDGLTTLLRD